MPRHVEPISAITMFAHILHLANIVVSVLQVPHLVSSIEYCLIYQSLLVLLYKLLPLQPDTGTVLYHGCLSFIIYLSRPMSYLCNLIPGKVLYKGSLSLILCLI